MEEPLGSIKLRPDIVEIVTKTLLNEEMVIAPSFTRDRDGALKLMSFGLIPTIMSKPCRIEVISKGDEK